VVAVAPAGPRPVQQPERAHFFLAIHLGHLLVDRFVQRQRPHTGRRPQDGQRLTVFILSAFLAVPSRTIT
jgi:hypothetical protein